MKITNPKKFLPAFLIIIFLSSNAFAADRITNSGGNTIEIKGEILSGLSGGNTNSPTGGAVYNEATITEIYECTFTGNSVSTESGRGQGGAIYNQNKGTINSITNSNFDGNYAVGSSTSVDDVAFGGAIYNSGMVDSITGCSFTNNYAKVSQSGSSSKLAYGGAIYNSGTINSIADSLFTGNYAQGGSYYVTQYDVAYGGAIYNSGTIDSITGSTFSGNSAKDEKDSSNSTTRGGAIANDGTINKIEKSSFSKNTADDGGAIYNNGPINSIADTIFSENEASEGGAIYNSNNCTIEEISGSKFSGNSASKSGGAIYNDETISTIKNTSFYDNSASSNGGAIYSTAGSIENISECTFSENSADGNGGAIYNGGGASGTTIENISDSIFSENTASENGGAIYNSGTISTITNTSFYDNSASGNGGAIYTTGDLTIVADGANVVFSGNTANGESNAIYMDNKSGKISFELYDGGSIYLYDGVGGAEGYSVDVSGDGTFYLLNDLEGAAFSVGNAISPAAAGGSGSLTLNTVDGKIHEYSLESFSLTSDINMIVDVDLASEKMDSFTASKYSFGEGDNFSVTITGMNFINEGSVDIGEDTKIYFLSSGTGLAEHVTISDSASMAYTPVFLYDVASGIDGEGLYFTFLNTGYNPAVLASSVAMRAAAGAMNLMFDANFEHSDYFMKLPEEVRLAKAEAAKAQKSASKIKENDPRRVAYYNQNEMTERGAWFKSFYANENVSYRGGWDSRDKYYGALVGFDSSLREHGDGWAHLFTGYVGTIGIRQEYSGGHIKQHGGLIGATGSFYRKNFYTAWTAAAGFTKADEHTMYGHDRSKNDLWGVAGKFGWNFEFGNGKFSLLPTFTASYSTVDPEDYTTAADVKISGGMRAVQLSPNLKLIMNASRGLQPYVTVGEVWTVGQSSSVKANGEKLPELELKAYTEYGIGVQKRWTNERDAYIQFLGHSHGRDGFVVNAGIRWNF